MTEDTILLEKSGGVARITLNRPALRNAFEDALISKLRAALIGRVDLVAAHRSNSKITPSTAHRVKIDYADHAGGRENRNSPLINPNALS
jgi:hypothetical protein